jgi:hypothetical protein
MPPQARKRTSNQRNNQAGRRPQPLDVWRTPDPLPEVEPVAAPHDVGALLRSLGDPPTIGGSNKAAHYFDAVLERSAAIAIALATSADLLADPLD